ncbi:phenylalanine 4-monooxygenase [Microbulbifer sp. 2205BS26-8]|uniref:phenylalanine 4-monooxygenase n=1 Tax=Microbulbifer sp. 2205BS26-8 TaxID=3064386 RepID=UPI002740174E|nr:phenylalanine 4-monooxygenase [Microbulbifer sp. 2205BS26-8]MDP5208887.1 phenylalanine 4-monooxygenase [Microbulbifer sp. 2205BS26-8]
MKKATAPKSSKYTAREPNAQGFIDYTDREHHTWQRLIERQLGVLPGRACDEYMRGLALLDLPRERIPQLEEISRVLRRETGWEVARVPALIGFETFFGLLAERKFPVATFIRTPEEFDYLQEPDIFHEIFGHCAMLTNPAFANFTEKYGQLGLSASPKERAYLARLYWFTVEFGLLKSENGLRIYGGGILSSPRETLYALSSEPEHFDFSPLCALRTPYRIDIVQPIYYVLNNLQQLQNLTEIDLMAKVHEAIELGLFEPRFPPKSAA